MKDLLSSCLFSRILLVSPPRLFKFESVQPNPTFVKVKGTNKGLGGGVLFVYHTPSFNRGTSGLKSSLKSPYVSPEQVMVS